MFGMTEVKVAQIFTMCYSLNGGFESHQCLCTCAQIHRSTRCLRSGVPCITNPKIERPIYRGEKDNGHILKVKSSPELKFPFFGEMGGGNNQFSKANLKCSKSSLELTQLEMF